MHFQEHRKLKCNVEMNTNVNIICDYLNVFALKYKICGFFLTLFNFMFFIMVNLLNKVSQNSPLI